MVGWPHLASNLKVYEPGLRKLLLIAICRVYGPSHVTKRISEQLGPLSEGRVFWKGMVVARNREYDVLEFDITSMVQVPRMRESQSLEK